jgi:hypothetical protein
MKTNEEILADLAKSIDECAAVLANPTASRKTLMDSSDKVLGLVSTCNILIQSRKFTDEDLKTFKVLYTSATNVSGKTIRFAGLMKWEGA